jgi:hypothetical protein
MWMETMMGRCYMKVKETSRADAKPGPVKAKLVCSTINNEQL